MLLVLFEFAPSYTFAVPAAQCFDAKDLSSTPGEAQIYKGPDAYRPPPTERPAPGEAAKVRGAIRRVKLPPGQNLIALTFDLCEQPYEIAGYDGRIVDILREESVRATFFAGGKWLLTHEKRAMQLMADPLFEIGDHTWEHRNLRLISGEKLRTEIEAPLYVYQRFQAKLSAICRPDEDAQGSP